jgi:hypothetical protein
MSQIQVWANFKKIFHVNGGELNANVNLPLGTDVRLAIHAVDSKGVTTKVVHTITVE